MSPQVSVVIATRDRPELLRHALASVARQSLADLEVIIVDDGSAPATLAGYDELKSDPRFIFAVPAAGGTWPSSAAAARNRGIKRARGRYVAFLDDDDTWRARDHLETAVRTLDSTGGDFFFGNIARFHHGVLERPDWFYLYPAIADGKVVSASPPVHEVSRASFMACMSHVFPHVDGCVIRRDLLTRIGGFWEQLRCYEDLDLMYRVGDQARGIFYRPDVVVDFEGTPRPTSASGSIPELERMLLVILALEHVRATAIYDDTIDTARRAEGWYLGKVGELLLAAGRGDEALSHALASLAVSPSLGRVPLLGRALRAQLPRRRLFTRARTLAADLERDDLSKREKALLVGHRVLGAAGISDSVGTNRVVVYEALRAPKIMGGMRDMKIRTGGLADLEQLVRVSGTRAHQVHERFARGDQVWVGELDGRLLCHAWFHRGPEPFDEDRALYARWPLDRDTFWSYDAATLPEYRASGVFIKVFQTALNALFGPQRARSVRCAVYHHNAPGIALHERNGFQKLGVLTAVALPGVKWLRWRDGETRHWMVPRDADFAVPLPGTSP